MSTNIEWTDATWNPTTGCDQVSPGCDHCYALTMAKRLKAMGVDAYQEDGDPRTSGPGFAIRWHEDRLAQPLRWRKPRKVFVNSMSDLFHPKVPDEFIGRVFNIMGLAERHTFQVLTKRPKRMRSFVQAYYPFVGVDEPYSNVWLGTSVEDQQRADERIPALLATPAAVRFLSMEPLLGPVDLAPWLHDSDCPPPEMPDLCICDDRDVREVSLDWIIVGGESGPGARPMCPGWARGLRDQATAAGVPFLFKQWGAWAPVPASPDGSQAPVFGDVLWSGGDHLEMSRRVGKHAAGRQLDGRTWDQFPQEATADA